MLVPLQRASVRAPVTGTGTSADERTLLLLLSLVCVSCIVKKRREEHRLRCTQGEETSVKAVLRVGWSISVLSLAAIQHGERLSCS